MNKFLKLLAVSLFSISSSAFAQSAFQGFYGQIATGYENNSVSNAGVSYKDAAAPNPVPYNNAPNQNFGNAPLIVGLGYNFSVAPKFILGIGADYSLISQTSATYNATNRFDMSYEGQSIKASNRLNIFVMPGYEIDKDKLIYLKAGYSSVKATYNPPTSLDGTAEPLAWSAPSSTVGGYIVGLGYKQIITGGFYGFAEGNYMSYNKPTLVSGVVDTGGNSYTITANPSISTYQLLVGVGYRF